VFILVLKKYTARLFYWQNKAFIIDFTSDFLVSLIINPGQDNVWDVILNS